MHLSIPLPSRRRSPCARHHRWQRLCSEAPSHGQALVEFALVLPILLLAFFAAIDGAEILLAHGNLTHVAQGAALAAAKSGGETPAEGQGGGVDGAVAMLASSDNLDPRALLIRFVTNDGSSVGEWHHASDPSTDFQAPHPSTNGTGVRVELRYPFHPSFGLKGFHAIELRATAFSVALAYEGGGPAS